MPPYVMGIDPGTGRSSPTGLVVFDPDTLAISMHENLWALHEDNDRRIRWLMLQVQESIEVYSQGELSLIAIETFVMYGKGGQTLQNLIGAYVGQVPFDVKIIHPFNTTVKKIVGGSGAADKEQVADGVLRFFLSNRDSAYVIRELIREEEWDKLDAFAIGIAGWRLTLNDGV
jgi:Holliday junction resolvasome RuvABC endonuclease subunit